jgi:hypothetical protein
MPPLASVTRPRCPGPARLARRSVAPDGLARSKTRPRARRIRRGPHAAALETPPPRRLRRSRIARIERAPELRVGVVVAAGTELRETARELHDRQHGPCSQLQADLFSPDGQRSGCVLLSAQPGQNRERQFRAPSPDRRPVSCASRSASSASGHGHVPAPNVDLGPGSQDERERFRRPQQTTDDGQPPSATAHSATPSRHPAVRSESRVSSAACSSASTAAAIAPRRWASSAIASSSRATSSSAPIVAAARCHTGPLMIRCRLSRL